MPVKIVCKQSSLVPMRGEIFPFLLLPLTLHEKQLLFCCSSFPASYTPHAVGWHSIRGTLRPLQSRARRNSAGHGGEIFLCLIFGVPTLQSFYPGQALGGLQFLFQNGWRGGKPGTHWLPTAICRCLSRLGSWEWSLPAGAGGKCRQAGWAQWTNHSLTSNAGMSLLQPLPVVLEAACVQNWGNPVLHVSGLLQQPAMVSLYQFCKIPLLYLNPLKMQLFAKASQVHHIHCFFYSTFNINQKLSATDLIKSDNFFSASHTVDVKVSCMSLPQNYPSTQGRELHIFWVYPS